MSDIPFEPINNIVLFLFAVVGGVTTVSGALVGGALFALLPYVQSRAPRRWSGLVFAGIAAVAISLGPAPERAGRDGHLVGRPAAPSAIGGGRPPGCWCSWLVVAGVGAGSAPAGAQSTDDPFAAYGGFNAAARSGGVQTSYDVKGVLPLPPPLLEITLPTSRASSATGPDLARVRVDGLSRRCGREPPVARRAGLTRAAARSCRPTRSPRWPSSRRAPPPNRQDIGTASATVAADAGGAAAVTSMAGSGVPGVVDLGDDHHLQPHRDRRTG